MNRGTRQLSGGRAEAELSRRVWRVAASRVPRGLTRALALAALVIAFPALVGFGDSPESRNRRGNRLYRDGKFDEALSEYRGAQVLGPELRELAFNAGNALYRKGELPNALREYEQASAAGDSIVSGNAFYNAGNAFLQMGDITAGIESYRAALVRNPRDVDAKYNLEFALRLLEQQQNEEQQEDQQDESEQDQEQQGQEGQDESEQDQEQQGQEGQDQQDQTGHEDEQDTQGQEEQQVGMSEEDAERLLDAIEESEKELQAELRSARAKQRKKVDKDW